MSTVVRTVIVDDNREFLSALKSFLGSLPDLELVGEGHDGDEAVTLLERLCPDLLIVDLMMPKRSGVDVLIRVARMSRRPRVIMLTLHSADEYRRVALGHGADEYVCKAGLVDELPAAISRLFPAATGLVSGSFPD